MRSSRWRLHVVTKAELPERTLKLTMRSTEALVSNSSSTVVLFANISDAIGNVYCALVGNPKKIAK